MAKLDRQNESTNPKLEESSQKVTVTSALRFLPDSENLKLEEETRYNNSESLAEAELRKCAEIIEQAAKTLLASNLGFNLRLILLLLMR